MGTPSIACDNRSNHKITGNNMKFAQPPKHINVLATDSNFFLGFSQCSLNGVFSLFRFTTW